MKTTASVLASLAIAACCLGTAAAATSSLALKLSAQNGSGENGTVTLSESAQGVTVLVTIPNGPSGPQPAHIHDGTCAGILGVAYPLTSIVDGNSSTLVKGVTIDQLLAGKYAINVHKSADNLGAYVACANIVAPANP